MYIVKSPFRVSFFGGSTDYKEFYQEHGSLLIGTTIDKFVYLCMRKRPKILTPESIISYSKLQTVKSWDEIENPLIREVLKYRQIQDPIEFTSFSDIPSRVGLGGSSSFCVGMLYLIDKVFKNKPTTDKQLALDAIKIERNILNEAGGIQDQIWPSYGGLNTVEIKPNGDFLVKPLPVTSEFKEELQRSLVLVYTNNQRNQNNIAKSHENKNKKEILDISKQAYTYFLNEDIKNIGTLLYQSWLEKRNISNLISTEKVDEIVDTVMDMGAYGSKLLGSGGCGFVLSISDPNTAIKIKEHFKNSIMPFEFENQGVAEVFSS
jgi:D-glycero-alpha-D-manno-heptose-7-phosphate kinase